MHSTTHSEADLVKIQENYSALIEIGNGKVSTESSDLSSEQIFHHE